MADSDCTGGKMALIPCLPKKKQSKLTLCPDAMLESNLFNKLCDEVLEEILLLLPAKSAVRFKVVCKRWYSLISSPCFITRFIHIRHHSHRDFHSGLIFQSGIVFQFDYSPYYKKDHPDVQIISNCSSLLSNLYGQPAFFLSYLPCPPTDLRLEGSFADLILCSSFNTHTKETNYYVINLLTIQWISLPPAHAEDEDFRGEVYIGFLCVPPSCFECKPVEGSPHHKFMVVRIWSPVCDNVPLSQFEVHVFSSEDYKWRTLVVSSSLPFKPQIVNIPLIACRGMLHWLNYDCIVVYDPLNTPNTFSRIIRLPIQLHLPQFIYRHGSFGVSQGRLRVVERSRHDAVDRILYVWELEDYDSGLWNLVYKVHLKNLIIPNGLPERLHSELRYTSVLSLHPENGDVIYLRIRKGVVPLNMKSRTMEGYYPTRKHGWVNAFQLADQWWPTPLSSLH